MKDATYRITIIIRKLQTPCFPWKSNSALGKNMDPQYLTYWWCCTWTWGLEINRNGCAEICNVFLDTLCLETYFLYSYGKEGSKWRFLMRYCTKCKIKWSKMLVWRVLLIPWQSRSFMSILKFGIKTQSTTQGFT